MTENKEFIDDADGRGKNGSEPSAAGNGFSDEAYNELVSRLFSRFKSFQTAGREAYHPGMQSMELFDSLIGHPHRKYRTIHVAGTNGKGSVSNMLAVALASTGLKVGLYTSPHLVDVRERIRVIDLSDDRSAATERADSNQSSSSSRQTGDIRDAVSYKLIPKEDLYNFCTRWRETFDHLHLSFFEITTALAFNWFADQKVDVAVIETGLGGRLDSTNIIMPVLSVITSIGLDHCDLLGNTLPEIAYEKAGIIKPGVPVVVGESSDESVAEVFKNKVIYANTAASSPMSLIVDREKALSLLHFADREPVHFNGAVSVCDVAPTACAARESGTETICDVAPTACAARESGTETVCDVAPTACAARESGTETICDVAPTACAARDKDTVPIDRLVEAMDLQGPYQRENLNTVLKSLELWFGKEHFTAELFYNRIAPALAHTASLAGFRGRWERLCDSPLVIADIGHNAHGLKANFARLESMLCSAVSSEHHRDLQQYDYQRERKYEQDEFITPVRHLVVVYGTMADKDWKSVAAMFPKSAHLIFTQADSPRALSTDVLAEYGRKHSLDFEVCPDVVMAYMRALSIASEQSDTAVYVGGSAYVVAEVEAALSSEAKSF